MPTKARPKKSAQPGPSAVKGRSRLLGALIAAAVCAATAGGYAVYRTVSGEDAPAERPVTVDEASRLALSRLTLYQASPAAVTLTADEGSGVRIEVTGIVDYRAHRGVGGYRTLGAAAPAPTAGPRTDQGLVVWDTGGLGLAPAPQGENGPPWQQAEHVARSGWSPRAYTTDPLDAGLQLLVQLGADRPDNPLLLAQSGARWLGRDRIDGRDYDRFSGPRARGAAPDGGRSPLTYWLDGDGGLRRVTMRMPGLGTPTTLEFTGRDAAAKLPDAPWIAG
ncbi:hypothetical protein [Kitasatospora sp. NPDC101183]|uniref:hypothetical protein n=1 Tax=Kitasatospora sp. NPDC101183 TaxID=3364100 RepID=UPI00382C0ABD